MFRDYCKGTPDGAWTYSNFNNNNFGAFRGPMACASWP